MNITEFVKMGANILEALKALPKLRPFDGLNIEEISNAVTTLFTEDMRILFQKSKAQFIATR